MSEESNSKAYFLGAGASAAAALPEKRVLTQDFLRRAFEMVGGADLAERTRASRESGSHLYALVPGASGVWQC